MTFCQMKYSENPLDFTLVMVMHIVIHCFPGCVKIHTKCMYSLTLYQDVCF